MLKTKRSTLTPAPTRPLRRLGARLSESRRTTLTLPVTILQQAERLARDRRQTVSAVVAGLLQQALRSDEQGSQRPARVLQLWKKAFAPLSEEEMLVVDGIVLGEPEAAPK